jgi:hypothetical protein
MSKSSVNKNRVMSLAKHLAAATPADLLKVVAVLRVREGEYFPTVLASTIQECVRQDQVKTRSEVVQKRTEEYKVGGRVGDVHRHSHDWKVRVLPDESPQDYDRKRDHLMVSSIKAIREHTSWGLKKAKDCYDSMRARDDSSYDVDHAFGSFEAADDFAAALSAQAGVSTEIGRTTDVDR